MQMPLDPLTYSALIIRIAFDEVTAIPKTWFKSRNTM